MHQRLFRFFVYILHNEKMFIYKINWADVSHSKKNCMQLLFLQGYLKNLNSTEESCLALVRKTVYTSTAGVSANLTILKAGSHLILSLPCYRPPRLLRWKSSHECSDVGRHQEQPLYLGTGHYHRRSWLEQVHCQSSNQHWLHRYILADCKQHQPKITFHLLDMK